MSKDDDIIDYRLQLQNLVRTGNHVVHALKVVMDMLGVPQCREALEILLKSQIDMLRYQLEMSSPKIDEVAQEYLHPCEDVYLEFGSHDENNAYLNYNLPANGRLRIDGKEYIAIEEALCSAADGIIHDINEYEDHDESDPSAWVRAEEPTFFDSTGNEIEDHDLTKLYQVRTVQIAIMRHYP